MELFSSYSDSCKALAKATRGTIGLGLGFS